jgi:hypothetical protein
MKSIRFLPLLLATLFLAGCGTLTQQDRTVLQSQGVSPDVYNKMLYGDPLSLSDVIELSQRAVPPGLITNYMDKVGTVYVLGKSDVKRLRAAGVNEVVIAYMLSTAPAYGPGGPPPYPYPYGYPYGPYPYGYYGAYGGPVFFVGGYGPWYRGRGGWGHGGWSHGGGGRWRH